MAYIIPTYAQSRILGLSTTNCCSSNRPSATSYIDGSLYFVHGLVHTYLYICTSNHVYPYMREYIHIHPSISLYITTISNIHTFQIHVTVHRHVHYFRNALASPHHRVTASALFSSSSCHPSPNPFPSPPPPTRRLLCALTARRQHRQRHCLSCRSTFCLPQ